MFWHWTIERAHFVNALSWHLTIATKTSTSVCNKQQKGIKLEFRRHQHGLSCIHIEFDGRGIDVAGEISEIEEKGKISRKLKHFKNNQVLTYGFHFVIEKGIASAQGAEAGARKTIAAKTCPGRSRCPWSCPEIVQKWCNLGHSEAAYEARSNVVQTAERPGAQANCARSKCCIVSTIFVDSGLGYDAQCRSQYNARYWRPWFESRP